MTGPHPGVTSLEQKIVLSLKKFHGIYELGVWNWGRVDVFYITSHVTKAWWGSEGS